MRVSFDFVDIFPPTFQVSSIVQVVGIIICLHAATKISHRALGVASIASRWHALETCSSPNASQTRVSSSVGNLEAANPPNLMQINHSENDLESLDYSAMPSNMQLAAYLFSYHKRQAFGMNYNLVSVFTLPLVVNSTIYSKKYCLFLVQSSQCLIVQNISPSSIITINMIENHKTRNMSAN